MEESPAEAPVETPPASTGEMPVAETPAPETPAPEPAKRGRGRPPGAKNTQYFLPHFAPAILGGSTPNWVEMGHVKK